MNNIILKIKNKIDKMYSKLTYFDQYGGSIITFIVLIIILGLVYAYTLAMRNATSIKDNWANERCNPTVIPFVGFINKPYDKTITAFTGENFQFCLNTILKNITKYATAPFEYIISGLTTIFREASVALQYIRVIISNIRINLVGIGGGIYHRLANFIIPIQTIVINMRDMLAKINATLLTGLYSSLSTYYILKSFLGSLVQLIVGFLGILVTMIIAMWIFPWTWPVAATMTAIFLSISVPLAVMVVFLEENFGISSPSIPGVPGRPPPICFDKDTSFTMMDGAIKKIINIYPGDVFGDGSICTTKLTLDRCDNPMYDINGTLVSYKHYVLYENNWLPVCEHPNATLIDNYDDPYLYCLNTNTKRITHHGNTYCDWDEILDIEVADRILTNMRTRCQDVNINKENMYRYLEGGFAGNTNIKMSDGSTKYLNEINVGDILDQRIKVLGVVKIDGMFVKEQNQYILRGELYESDKPDKPDIIIECSPNVVYFDRGEPRTTISLLEGKTCRRPLDTSHMKLYHLITSKEYFYIGDICFNHYSYNTEYFNY